MLLLAVGESVHAMPCHAMPCHAMPCQVCLCQVKSVFVLDYVWISFVNKLHLGSSLCSASVDIRYRKIQDATLCEIDLFHS